MKIIKKAVLFLFLLADIGACSHVDEITPRSYVAFLVSDTKEVKDEIELALSKQGPISKAGRLEIKPRADGLLVMPVDFAWVTAGGAIVVSSKKYGVLVIQEPRVVDGKVVWSCIVYPADAKPNACGVG